MCHERYFLGFFVLDIMFILLLDYVVFVAFFIFAQGTFFKQLCVYTCIIYIIILFHFDDTLGSSLKKKKCLFAPNQ